ncbi:MAG: hypothetical protein M1609_02700 [Firmicutes bacterium]|nr:hypothetical protein [Bacillota bacterium]
MSSRMMLLNLVKEGKITVEQAAELLCKMELSRKSEAKPVVKVNFLRVRLEDLNLKKVLIDTKLPTLLVKMGIQMSEKIWTEVLEEYPDLKNFRICFNEVYTRIEQHEGIDNKGKNAEG